MDKTSYQKSIKIFQSRDLFAGKKHLQIQFGNLNFNLVQHSKEVHAEWHYSEQFDSASLNHNEIELENKKNFIKWVNGGAPDSFFITPLLPDKSMVLRSNHTLHIPGKAKTRFYILIPLFLQINRNSKSNDVFIEKSVIPISHSWFGNMDSGELGYHQLSSFYQELKNLPSKYYQAICPLTIDNQSGGDLKFDKLLLESRFLNLYQGPDNYWTNEVTVTYNQDQAFSKVKIHQSAPKECQTKKIFKSSREVYPNNLVRTTFEKIKEMARV